MIIDAHAHVFEQITGRMGGHRLRPEAYGRVLFGDGSRQVMPPSFERSDSRVEMLLAHMRDCGVSRAVLMSNPFYGYHSEYTLRCTAQYPGCFYGVALVDLFGGVRAADALRGQWDRGLFGMKIETDSSIQRQPDLGLDDPLLDPLWEACDAAAQPVFLHLCRDSDLRAMEVLTGRYPQIPFVLCHLGADACFAKATDAFERCLALLRSRPNVMADLSTVPEYFGEPYPFEASQKAIEQAYRAAGAERLMWGTDYPGMLKLATYRQLFAYFADGCKGIPERDKDLILGGNAERLFGFICKMQ